MRTRIGRSVSGSVPTSTAGYGDLIVGLDPLLEAAVLAVAAVELADEVEPVRSPLEIWSRSSSISAVNPRST